LLGSGGTKIVRHVPLAHWPSVEQVSPLFNLQEDCPSLTVVQMFTPVQGVAADTSSAPLTAKQVPGLCAWLQLRQVPSHASLQQTPSTQLSDTQSSAAPQAPPFLRWHPPSPSQVLPPEQPESPSSVNLGTAVQDPSNPGRPQDWQVPHADVVQQTPSTQFPEAHSLDAEQLLPRFFRHVADSSHIESPLQVSSVAFLTGEQVPTFPVRAQLTHDPSQALSQQTPSTQKPLAHCAPTVQV
jgi:hypothetical protein